MTLNIHPMTQEDKPGIMHILRNTPEFKPSEVAIAEELIDSYLCDPHGSGYNIFMAKVNSIVVGYICYGPTPLTDGTWDIYWMAVAGQKQRQGIGSALLEQAENEIRKAQGRLALVETSSTPAYEKSRQFHLRHGYEIIACIPDFYAPGDDMVILRKQLK